MPSLAQALLSGWVFFDLDNTLVDLEQLHFMSFKETIQRIWGINITWEEDYLNYIYGYKHPDYFIRVLKARHVTPTEEQLAQARTIRHDILIPIIKQNPHQIKITAGATELLTTLKKHRFKIAVVTSSSKLTANSVLSVTRLYTFIDILVSADDVKLGKPHPEPYLKAKDLAGIPHINPVLTFEDSPAGITSALKANNLVIALLSPKSDQDLLKKIYAVIKDFTDITSMIQHTIRILRAINPFKESQIT